MEADPQDVSAADRRRRCVLLWLAVAALLGGRLWQLREYVIDDAFISFQYARNLAEGRGLVFNEGERVEGYSNLPWVLAMAPFIRAGVDPLLAARALSVVCVCLTFLVMLRVSVGLNGGADEQAALAPMGLALCSSYVMWILGGLETQLMALCVVALLWALWRRLPWAAALLSVTLVFVRPEGVAYSVAASVAALVIQRLDSRRGWAWATPMGVGLATFITYSVWRLVYFGSVLPNVFHAKGGGSLYQLGTGVQYVYACLATYAHPALFALLIVTWLTRREARTLLTSAGLLIAVGVAFAVYAGGDWMPGYRFLVPVMPLAYLCLQEGARDGLSLLARATDRRAAAAVGIVGWTLFLGAHCVQFPAAQGWAHSFGTEHALARATGELIARRSEPGAVIAVADAGAIPYFSRQRTIDRRGLMDRHIARLRRSDFMWKCDEQYVLQKQPDYVESQLKVGTRLDRLTEAEAAGTGFPPGLRAHLRRLPSGVSLGQLLAQARWSGDMQLYSSRSFLDEYRPILIYRVPGLWHVVISERK